MNETSALAPLNVGAEIERVVVSGDLSRLTPEQRVSYVNAVCKSAGLNPLTQPFAYITLSGKLTLYAKREATDQLRALRSVSIAIASREIVEDVLVVTARATMPDGRTDESIGAVVVGGLKGEARANAMMKAETKAKRRVTLSACGLGILDETEADTIPTARFEPVAEVVREPVPARIYAAEPLHEKDPNPPGPDDEWLAAIAGCASVDALHELRTAIRESFGRTVPRQIANAWKDREAALKVAA